MAYNRRILEGRRGDDVLTWWQAVLSWARSLPVVLGPNMRMTQTPLGMRVRVITAEPVRVPFQVGITDRRARIRDGYVEGEVPYVLVEDDQYIRLDGILPDGSEAPSGRPTLDLTGAEPGEDGRSALVVAVEMDDLGVFPDLTDAPERLVIEHRSGFGPVEKRAASREGRPFQEIAVLYWSGETIVRVGQVVTMNQVVLRAADDSDEEGRRYFFTAA